MTQLDKGAASFTGLRLESGRTDAGEDGSSAATHAIASGEVIARYQVRRLLGQGGMGQVYLARDVMLGRSVALKVVRHERVGAAGSERFVEEARLLAALNHPHIVQLYDAGVHRGDPYLALEYVEGETLRRRGTTYSLDEVIRLTRAVADALVHAHGSGILHCDLKPSNILLGRDGRLRVVDFGLARRAAGGVAGREGTPEWMAPEQWQGQPLTDRVDVWALAIVLIEMLGGPHPFGPLDATWHERLLDADVLPALPARRELSPQIHELLTRSLEREPSRRPSAKEWLHALEDAMAGRDMPASTEGPYRGLAAFGEQDARDFYGRDAEIDGFLERLRAVTLLPIVGPSGVGKSSFLHAGVIPRLRARSAWTVISLRPGSFPIETLARKVLAAGHGGKASTLGIDNTATAAGFALGQDEAGVRALARELRATPALLAMRLATLAGVNGRGVLLAIDQLEELFTHGAPEPDIASVLAMLLQAADDPREDVRVVVTVRDDFVGRLAGLRELFVMRQLGPEDLRLAIIGPLRRTGYSFDNPAVIDEMLSELGAGSASKLPLLQFACRALWDGRDVERRTLLHATYNQIRGVAGALAQHADGVIDGMTSMDQGLARQVFLRLLVGTARRTVPRKQLEADLPEAGSVLDRLVSSRLVVQSTSVEGISVVEIAHEALLRSWGRLQRWLDETRDERRLLAELDEAAAHWRKRGRRPEETWPAEETAATRHRCATLGLAAPVLIEEFLAASELRQRTMRRRSRTRLAVAALSALAVTTLSVLLAGEYRRQKLAAEQQTEALRLAGSNLGRVDLVLAPFDWVGNRPVGVDAVSLPALSWRVFGAKPGDEHTPGGELPAALVRHMGQTALALARVDRAELPGGTAFLRIDGRGRLGESCAPSWIRIQSIPGYASRQQPGTRIALNVPTCAASVAGTATIEAGPFVYGGVGEPKTRSHDKTEPEQIVDLPEFAIDRTEVSNEQFAPFAQMREVTGYPVPDYPLTELHKDAGLPMMPVTAVDAFEAEAFCRFMGKRLPGDHEWTKAARGGLVVHGVPNPTPRRLYPWGSVPANCSNVGGTEDGYRWLAPVDAFPCGASPYGVLNLAGNAAEWISREGQTDRAVNPLWIIRGGEVDAPADLDQATTVFRNERQGRQFTFAVGFRCVIASEGKVP